MHIKYRQDLEKLEIGDTVVVSSLGRTTVRTIDAGNMRLLLQSLESKDAKPSWYGYDMNDRVWRALFQVYSGSLHFDMSQRAVAINK